MSLSIPYVCLVLMLLMGGTIVGVRYAQAYVRAIRKGAAPSWSTALHCAQTLADGRVKNLPFSWSCCGLLILLAAAVLVQTYWLQALLVLLLVPLLSALWHIDERSYLLPDALVTGVVLLGLAYAYIEGALALRLIFAVCMYGVLYGLCGVYERFSSKPSMGKGDIKLIAAFCLWIGLAYFLSFMFVATVLLLAAALFQSEKKESHAFGPFLMMAGILMLVLESF